MLRAERVNVASSSDERGGVRTSCGKFTRARQRLSSGSKNGFFTERSFVSQRLGRNCRTEQETAFVAVLGDVVRSVCRMNMLVCTISHQNRSMRSRLSVVAA